MTRAATVARALAAVACLAIGPGCLRTKAVRYYTLAGGRAAAPIRQGVVRYTVRVAPASVPETLDRPELVLRVSATELAIDESHQWAEPLRTGIARAVADGLARDLDGALVSTSENETMRGPSDVEVSIDVRHLELALADGAAIDIAWKARWRENGPTRTGRAIARIPSAPAPSHDAAVAACAAALDAVSKEIAQSVRSDYLSRR
jgi:uncharacterized lipoprotein YmbA